MWRRRNTPTLDGSENWYCHYEDQYGGSVKN